MAKSRVLKIKRKNAVIVEDGNELPQKEEAECVRELLE